MEIEGRVALVTGGATGIGHATVLHLARSGAAGVVINYRSAKDKAEELADQVRKLGSDAMCVYADLKDDNQVRDMVRQVTEKYQRLDILVNNAGVTHWVPIADLEGLTEEMWDDILDVNLKAAFSCTRAAATALSETQGMVINVSSTSGVLATTTISSLAYGCSKAALIYLTRGLAVSLAPKVRVNAVAPAFTDTEWMQNHFGDDYEQVVAKASAGYPLGRIGTTEDIAAAIIGMITGGDFVTGQTLLIDGGLSLS